MIDNLKSSFFVIGNLLIFFSVYSFVPGLYDYFLNGSDWVVFFVISIVCFFTGLNILYAQCPAVPSPYTENFSGGGLPSCWQQSATSGDGGKFTGNPGYAAANNGRPAGSFAWVDFSGTDAGTVMEVVPVDVSSNTNPQIEFDFFCFNTTQPNPTNILHIEANDGTGWISVGTIQNNTFNGWAPYTYTLVGFDVKQYCQHSK